MGCHAPLQHELQNLGLRLYAILSIVDSLILIQLLFPRLIDTQQFIIANGVQILRLHELINNFDVMHKKI